MLKKRVITAAILIVAVLVVNFWFMQPLFDIAAGALMLCAAWEWFALTHTKNSEVQKIYLVALAGLLFLSGYFFEGVGLKLLLLIACFWWVGALYLVRIYPKQSFFWQKRFGVAALLGFFVFVTCWEGLITLRLIGGPGALLYFLVLIWGADSVAYFVGKQWGKRPLLPLVSPGKTMEGFQGALIFSGVFGVFGVILFYHNLGSLLMLPLSVITVFFSVVGDLSESVLKRNAGVKDSGHLIPGHGGVLDRIDSILAATPFFVLGFLLLN